MVPTKRLWKRFLAIYLIGLLTIIFLNTGCSPLASDKGQADIRTDSHFTQDDALEKVLNNISDFPKLRRGVSVDVTDVHIGGGIDGAITHITYSAQVTGNTKEGYIVTLTKDWHLNVNGTPVVSTYTWRVSRENITLLQSRNKDDLVNEIK